MPENYVDVTESTAPHMPLQIVSPENFRRVVQQQINAAVAKEVNGITAFNATNDDFRFSNSRPSATQKMSNANGFMYFIVGASIVGLGAVAAP